MPSDTETAATTFNPFNTDINTVRGQETGYATFNPLYQGSNSALSEGNLNIFAHLSDMVRHLLQYQYPLVNGIMNIILPDHKIMLLQQGLFQKTTTVLIQGRTPIALDITSTEQKLLVQLRQVTVLLTMMAMLSA